MKVVYTDLTKLNLGDLKEAFKKVFVNSVATNFILNELNCRRDKILFDKELSAEQKEGALIQLRELVDFFNGGVAYAVQNILNQQNKKIVKKTTEKLDKNKLREELNRKTLK